MIIRKVPPKMQTQTSHRIVIVGGGAGGLELATQLGRKLGKHGTAHITLVDRNATHIWKPMLHEVAAGSMDPYIHQVQYAAQAHWNHFQFEQGDFVALDREAKTITLAPLVFSDSGEDVALLPERTLRYDTLVLAIGSTTNFFNVEGAEQHALALDTVAQAERFRRLLISALVRAPAKAQHNARPLVRVAIIGGGATGVELAAELRTTASELRDFGVHKLDPWQDVTITLIEGNARILPALSERVATATAQQLSELGVAILTGDVVAKVEENVVQTKGGQYIPTDLTVWAAGIKGPAVLAGLSGLTVTRSNQIEVHQTLQSKDDPSIFAFGDCAACPWPETGRMVPPRAQAASQQASFLAKALPMHMRGETLPEYGYRDLGSLISLGHWTAVGSLMGGVSGKSLFIEGFLARLMYVSLYRKHVMALTGPMHALLDALAQRLRKSSTPRIKLH
ncbi:NAD(P)/FAD-dependent oxidoreductase [Robbsia sp. KACC 23696]|uniref:NAD(P)/FAD-dependent oxidoreductase n=1 Tax=Robbsia sp. KACC 23696 TaxID=3149231 RepID=UPI00325ABB0C